jgi:hypothetical protein
MSVWVSGLIQLETELWKRVDTRLLAATREGAPE